MPWRGIDVTAKGNHWRYTIEKLEELDVSGDIYWPPKGTMPRLKMYVEDAKGELLQDWWGDISPINSQGKERLGYPTQKPEALLERIVSASSNEGDVVLDPFCGCGTAIAATERLNRRWIGIDITHLAVTLIRHRLQDTFKEDLKPYEVLGAAPGRYQCPGPRHRQRELRALPVRVVGAGLGGRPPGPGPEEGRRLRR